MGDAADGRDHMATTKKTGATSRKAGPKQSAAKKPAPPTTADKKATSTKTAPKKAARRDDYDEPIGPWFDQWPPEKRTPLHQLRRLVEKTVPQATSGLKWGVPFWTLDGTQFCDLVALKHEVALGIFAPPEVFDDPDGQLSGTSNEYRVLKVKDGAEFDAESVQRWLLAAVDARS
jgi:hypothetical protein